MALDDNRSKVLDGEPVLALDVIDGLPSGLPSELAGELAEVLEDAERYAAAAQAINTSRPYASAWNQVAGVRRGGLYPADSSATTTAHCYLTCLIAGKAS